MAAYLDISEIMQWLGYTDPRPALTWCEKHDVFVLTQGRSKVVNRTQFLLAFHKPFIQHLKNRFPNWAELFRLYVENDLQALAEHSFADAPHNSSKYKPTSKAEKDFLDKIMNL